jgi:hypothetical protein
MMSKHGDTQILRRVNRIGFALLIGTAAGIGTAVGTGSPGIGLALGVAVTLIFGLEFA